MKKTANNIMNLTTTTSLFFKFLLLSKFFCFHKLLPLQSRRLF